MLDVKNLGYRYGRKKFVLSNISFSLEDGYVMCIIGKNGAGKTTLLQAIYGSLKPSEGNVAYNDNIVVASKKQAAPSYENQLIYHEEVALVGDFNWCFEDLSIKENVDTLKELYTTFDEEEYIRLLKYFDLDQIDDSKKIQELSTGQEVLLQLAFNMARHPKLLLLDEPFANLDPVVKVDISALLQDKMTEENTQIIISTHLVDDISDMVDYVGCMENGRMTTFMDRESLFEKKGVEGLREYILEEEE